MFSTELLFLHFFVILYTYYSENMLHIVIIARGPRGDDHSLHVISVETERGDTYLGVHKP